MRKTHGIAGIATALACLLFVSAEARAGRALSVRLEGSSQAILAGGDVKSLSIESDSGKAVVILLLKDEAAKRFADATGGNIGKSLSIELDGRVLAAPAIKGGIAGGALPIPDLEADDVVGLVEAFLGQPGELADSGKHGRLGPEETARGFFRACADMDWDEAGKFYHKAGDPGFRGLYGGLAVVRVGAAFKSGKYPGWYVPYEIRLKSGEVKKWNLAVRNDNPEKRFVVDGGL